MWTPLSDKDAQETAPNYGIITVLLLSPTLMSARSVWNNSRLLNLTAGSFPLWLSHSASLKNHLSSHHLLRRQPPPARLASEQLHPCPHLLICVSATSLSGIYCANCGALTPVAAAMVRALPVDALAPSRVAMRRSNVCLADNCSRKKEFGTQK